MVADRTKKAKTEEKSEDDNKNENGPLNEELILSIEKLQEIQEELEKINEEASDKVLEVEQKYNEERKPVYEKRNEIIKSIPDFWLTAFLSHPVLGNLLTDEDQKIFKHLTAMEVEDNKDIKSGFSITFKFESNPYFENDKLTKTFAFSSEGTTKVNSTPIQWKEGMGPPKEASTEKKGKKRALPEESFFVWFSNNEVKDAVDDMQDEIVEIIKEDLWPNPLAYFNSEEGDFDGDEGDEGDNDGDDSDGEEDDDENGDDGEDDEENDDDEEDAE